MESNDPKKYTEAGTDIEEVKRQNANSGLTYNEIKEVLAKSCGFGTGQYSDTDAEAVREQNR
ncbi:gamma-type small acid-soluble spore protein [Sporosarcina sp. ACRSM]|uniref:gamma-type small acid-soluble spore protein n=1 Tax=Sporosarcina sp. ACRSM TaxID=2918216 RepID=UPI001EF488CB|nr:gamma-type small acid-soluble spore protein [Sporosarcina sp. ACRSM]MCG7333808.1 gamma-type small acid-soluble spore protein [Sporosarcina sp. ACRSM]